MSSAQESTVDVNLQNIAFGPVGEKTDANIKSETRIADTLPDAFGEYIAELVDKDDIINVEHGTFDSESEIEDHLQTILNTNDDEEYLESTIELVRRLDAQMTGRATPGTLFVAKAQVSGSDIPEGETNVVALLKMDNMIDRRVFIDGDDLGEINEDDAFPQSRQLQKGALYPAHDLPPHTRKGDIKIYQKSGSEYFRYFFDCDTRVPSSLEQSREVQSAVNSILSDTRGRGIQPEDMSQIISEAEDEDGTVNRDTIESSLESITDGDVESEVIEETFSAESLRDLQIDADKFPKFTKRTVKTANKEITIKFPMDAGKWVDVRDDGDTVEVKIQGDEIDQDFVDR